MAIPNCTYYESLVTSNPVEREPRVGPDGLVHAPTTPGIALPDVTISVDDVAGRPTRVTNDPTPLASAAAVALGPAGRTLILVGSSLSMFAYVSGMMLNVPRMLFAFARDGFLPAALARVHPAWRTPYVAIAAQAVIVAAVALFAKFEVLAVAANATGLAVYAVCCLAAGELRRRDVRAGGVPFVVPGGAIVPWLAVAVIGWMLWGLRREEWYAAGLVILVAMGLYVATAAARRRRVAEVV